MGGDKKNKAVLIRLSEDDRAFIEKKMALIGTENMSAYIRKMAMDGYVINVDMGVVKDLVFLVRNISNNVNQITKRVGGTGNLYAEDVEDIRKGYNKVWSGISALLAKINQL